MGAERVISAGQVGDVLGGEVAEGGREAVAAMLARGAAQKPVQPHLQTLESFIGDVRLLALP